MSTPKPRQVGLLQRDATDFFGPPIYAYTDETAVEDGFLVPLNNRDRITRAAYVALAKAAEFQTNPPNYWTVDLFGYCRAKTGEARALAMAGGLVDVNRHTVERDGGPLAFYAIRSATGYVRLVEVEPADAATFDTYWLEANERGGVTVMLPGDH